MKILGIDIGGSYIKFGVLDENNEIIDNQTIPNTAKSKEEFLNLISTVISNLNSKHNFQTVGIGLPGNINQNGIVSTSPNLPYWVNQNFVKEMSPLFQCPFIVENDAFLAGFAESKLNELEEYYFVTLGTGIGSALIRNHKIVTTNKGISGELGHIILDMNANGNNFRTGVFENYFNANMFVEKAKADLRLFPNSFLATLEEFSVREISDAVAMGDDLAILTFISMGEILGIGFSSVANLTGITIFVIGGGISQVNNLLFESATKKMKERVLPGLKDLVEIQISKLHNQAGIIGATQFAKEKLL